MPFHVSVQPYKSGDIITRGWFGKNLHMEPQDVQIREHLYEAARIIVAPTMPSRLRSCFFFDDFNDADRFKNNFRNGAGIIYEVDLNNSSAQIHKHVVSATGVPAIVNGKIDIQRSFVTSVDFWLSPAIYMTNTESFAEVDLRIR